MAATPVIIYGNFAGLTTPTLKLYAIAGGAIANGSGDTLTVDANASLLWVATVDEALAGIYYGEVVSSSVVVAYAFFVMADITSRVYGVTSYAEALEIQRNDGITSMPKWLRALARESTPDSTALSEINSGGGTYSATRHSLEALRKRGDNAWTTLTQPVSSVTPQTWFIPNEGTKVIIQNDSYSLTRRPLRFIDSSESNPWPLATGDYANITAIKFTATNGDDTIAVSKTSSTGDWVESDGTSTDAEINVPLTSANTAVDAGTYSYDLQVTLSDGDVITLEIGELTVTNDITDPN